MIKQVLTPAYARVALKGGSVAAVVTAATAPLVRSALLRSNVMDVPNHRSSHSTPIPRGGGIACLIGVSAGVAAMESTERLMRRRVPVALVVTPLAISALGFADDFLGGLHFAPRLAAQLVGGAATATADLPIEAGPAAVMLMPSVVNVFNFMDGINGISALTCAVWGLNAAQLGSQRQDLTLMGLGAITSGAGLGFLPWNAPKAQLFLGDTGSYLFGALMATGVVAAARSPFGQERATRWADAARTAAPLLPYVADAAQAIARRVARGEQITEAHREHVYQRVTDTTKLSHLQVASLHAAVAAAVGAAARLRPRLAVPATAVLAGAYLALPSLVKRGVFGRKLLKDGGARRESAPEPEDPAASAMASFPATAYASEVTTDLSTDPTTETA